MHVKSPAENQGSKNVCIYQAKYKIASQLGGKLSQLSNLNSSITFITATRTSALQHYLVQRKDTKSSF